MTPEEYEQLYAEALAATRATDALLGERLMERLGEDLSGLADLQRSAQAFDEGREPLGDPVEILMQAARWLAMHAPDLWRAHAEENDTPTS